MANLSGFNAADVEPSTGFDCVPAGEYEVVITDSEMKATRDGGGEYLKLEFTILNGEFQNQKIFTNLNLMHEKPKVVQIAKAQLSAICRAVGVLTPRDSSELHGKPMMVKVTVKKSDEYGDQNQIKSFNPRGSTPPVNASAVSVPAGEPAPWAV